MSTIVLVNGLVLFVAGGVMDKWNMATAGLLLIVIDVLWDIRNLLKNKDAK